MNAHTLRNAVGLFSLLILFTAGHSSAQDRVQQELDRVSNLLQQLDLESSRETPLAGGTRNQSEHSSNPFTTKRPETTKRSVNPPQVSIGEKEIRINVAGQELLIDRPKPQRVDPAAESAPAEDFAGSILQSLTRPELERARIYQQYALALAEFDKGHYPQAKQMLNELGDTITHEGIISQTFSLMLFQTGDFQQSAEWAYNSLQSVEPFDWKAIQGLYGNSSDYAISYQKLQKACEAEPERVELHFLLGYHHLMLGHRQHAEQELKIAEHFLDDDPVVQKLLREVRNAAAKPPQPLSD